MMKRGPAKIFLVRHGESVFNRDKCIAGQLDVPLSPKGIDQSLALERLLRGQSLDAIYTSTLSRARQTADPIAAARGLVVHQYADLMEVNHGSLQGRYRDARDVEAQALWQQRANDKLHFAMPDGESYADVERRVRLTLQAIAERESGNTILIVGHRTTNRAILQCLLQWSPEHALEANPRSRYVYEIKPGPCPEVRTLCLREKNFGQVIDGFHC